MKNAKQILPVLAVLLPVSLSCTFIKERFSKDSSAGIKAPSTNISSFDPNAPLPSGGAMALRQLAEFEPSAATLVDSVEAAERSAMRKALDEVRPKSRNDADVSSASDQFSEPTQSPTSRSSLASMALLQAGQSDEGEKRIHTAEIMGGIIAYLGDIFAEVQLKKNDIKPGHEEHDGVTVDTDFDVTRGADGTTVSVLTTKTEGTRNGIRFKTETNGKVDGQQCPNSEGQVSLTVTLHLGAEANGSIYDQDLTAFVRAVVNEDARVASRTIDVIQATRHVKEGRQLYIETGQTFSREGTTDSISNYREIRTSSEVKPSDLKIRNDGLSAAYLVGVGALEATEYKWSNGGCVTIEARSPGKVAINSSNLIPVVVRHKIEKTEVPSKLDVVLKGEKSVDPTSIARTAGTLTYIAPSQNGKTATISLTATSRRGRATLDLTANTGGNSFRVSGSSNGVSFTGEICSLNKPFDIAAKFPGGTATTSFSPSDDASGSTTVSGGGGGCTHSGGGNYTISTAADGTATLKWTTADTIKCPGFSNSRTATFSLPLQPGPKLSCP